MLPRFVRISYESSPPTFVPTTDLKSPGLVYQYEVLNGPRGNPKTFEVLATVDMSRERCSSQRGNHFDDPFCMDMAQELISSQLANQFDDPFFSQASASQ